MESSHCRNTGLAKFISDCLYSKNSKDTMNPMQWYNKQNGVMVDVRDTINGFPCRLIMNNVKYATDGSISSIETTDYGIFNFNLDKGCTNSFGLDNEVFPQCASYEITANSDISAGAFVPYVANESQTELQYLQESFELRYPDEKDVGKDYGYLGMVIDGELNSEYGLKRVVDFIGNSTDEDFKANFDKYFNKHYTFRYFLLVILLGMVDNLGKNLMLDTWDGKIWYPRFYDLDTDMGLDNSGSIKFDVDIEMAQGYWNTSKSKLWTKILDLFFDELVAEYKAMRGEQVSYEKLMQYLYDNQIALIPATFYNRDAQFKYFQFAQEYLGKAHGSNYEFLQRWVKNRFLYVDTLFDYSPTYINDAVTIRANTLDTMNLVIETYTPQYVHLSWKNGVVQKLKVDGKNPVTFSGSVDTATDQEVIIYGAYQLKRLTGIQSCNPDQILIGQASRLIELDLSNCTILTEINSNKANLQSLTYLKKLDLSGCSSLTGTLRINYSNILEDLNLEDTLINSIQFSDTLASLKTLKLPSSITTLNLQDASSLSVLHHQDSSKLTTLTLSNCNNLTDLGTIDLGLIPTLTLDNSYNSIIEYYSKGNTTSLTLENMPNLERVVFTPNNEYEEFTMDKVINGKSYKVITANNPKMKEFITTAPHRTSYKNGEYGDITPYTVFTANTLDLSNTHFEDVKFLCTTDLYNLKLPNTLKNFYCDSAMDIDTDVIEDASYKVIHDELIEEYTTNYEKDVYKGYTKVTEKFTMPRSDKLVGDRDYNTDYIAIKPGSTYTAETEASWLSVVGFDEHKSNKTNIYISSSVDDSKAKSQTIPEGVHYIMFGGVGNNSFNLTYEKPYTPNIIPSSASGSLIFNMYSNNTTQPTSTSPYMWDLTGLKLNDFYTYGMNNWVKPSEDSLIEVNKSPIYYLQGRYTGSNFGNIDSLASSMYSISPILLSTSVTKTSVITSDSSDIYYYYSTDFDGTVATSQNFAGCLVKSGSYRDVTNSSRISLISVAKTCEWFDLVTSNGSNTNKVRYYLSDMIKVNTKPSDFLNLTNNGENIYTKLLTVQSITMPQRYAGYSVRMINADITPNTYPNHLYPLLVDTTLPITGKLDYTKYQGSSLAWAYAYTTSDVSIKSLDSQHQQNITNDYNKLYNTDYVDIIDVWAYKEDDFTNRETNTKIKKAYIELTQSNYQSRIDEVLKWYPNCTDIYLFEDGSVTSLVNFIGAGEDVKDYNPKSRNQVTKISFMEGYFNNLTSLFFCI